jgi:hypothetical protein
MLFLMALVYVCTIRRKIGMYTSALLTPLVFVGFNTVFFRQCMCWIVPFMPLSICDVARSSHLCDWSLGVAPSGGHPGQVGS